MTKRVKYTAISKEWKLILFFVLLFRRVIEIGFQPLHVFVCNALFDVISPLGNLVIAYHGQIL